VAAVPCGEVEEQVEEFDRKNSRTGGERQSDMEAHPALRWAAGLQRALRVA